MNPLDTLQPPPMSLDFTDRVIAAARARTAETTDMQPRARSRPWVRRGFGTMGVALCGLVGAAAAATGMLGERIQNMPVISVIAEKFDARHKVVPITRADPVQPVNAKVASPAPTPTKPEVLPAPVLDTVNTDPLAERLDRINARRTETGRAPIDRAELDQRIAARKARAERRISGLPPKRQEKVRAKIAERAALREAAKSDPAAAEQLQAIQEERRVRLKAWRERRMQRQAVQPSEAADTEGQPEIGE